MCRDEVPLDLVFVEIDITSCADSSLPHYLNDFEYVALDTAMVHNAATIDVRRS